MYGDGPYRITSMPSRSARLETRIAPDTLTLAKRAAEIEGRSLSDFVATALRDAAQRTIQETSVVTLSLEGQQRFVDLLIEPPEPGPGLRKAFAHHGRLLGGS